MRYFNKSNLPTFIQWLCVVVIIAIATTTLAQSQVSFQYFYDSLNRLVRVIDSNSNVVTYTYDQVGNLVSVTRTTVANLPPPMLTTATPNQVNQDDPATVMLVGTGLLGGAVTATHPGITINQAVTIDDTKISVSLTVAPTAQLGPASLTVTTIRGSTSINITIVGPRPRITSISPSQGPSTGGTPVTVAGSKFTADTTVMFGGNLATNVVMVNASTLTAVTPAGPSTQPPTSVDVVVSNSLGSATLTNGFRYIFGLNCGDLAQGSIGTSGEIDRFAFNGVAGNIVLLTLVQTSAWPFGTTPRATVELPNGATVVTFDANGQQRITLSETGVYSIRVYANNLVNTGSYNLGLECLRPLGPVDGTLSCGSLLSGTINASGEVDLLTFTGQATNIMLLTLVQTSAWAFGTTPRATVEAPSGAVVVTFDANSQQRITLSENGTYTIRVYANNLVSTGSYNFGLECLRPLGPVDTTLTCGNLSPGVVSASGEVDVLTFTGEANQVVLLTLVQTSAWAFGTTPRATVEAPSGTVVVTFDANGQQRITLSENGVYVIRVQANNLANTGSYNLGLECLRPLGSVDGTLSCGSLLSGTINASGEVDIATFTGQANDVILLTLVQTSAWAFGTTPRATVEAPSGAVVVTFDANGQQRITLSESGVYIVRVNANNLVSTGSYNFGLECLRPLGPVDGALSCADLSPGMVSASAEVDLLTFTGEANQVVLLTLVQTSAWAFGTTARATVESPSGAVVITFDANSQQRITLVESGTYVIRVYANNLVSTGSYNLGLECLRPLGPVDGTLSCGTLLSGSVNASGEVDLLTFTGQATNIMLLTLVQTSAWAFGTTARATVEAPSGAVVVTFDANSQRRITLTESGTYVIRVYANNLVSTGSYNLGLECLRPLGPIDGTLSCGTPSSGAISASGEVDLLTFTGQTNQVVTLMLTNTSAWPFGTTAQATVETPSGTVMVTFDANGQRQLTLPENGIYLVRVNANNLVSTGSYSLSLQCSP